MIFRRVMLDNYSVYVKQGNECLVIVNEYVTLLYASRSNYKLFLMLSSLAFRPLCPLLTIHDHQLEWLLGRRQNVQRLLVLGPGNRDQVQQDCRQPFQQSMKAPVLYPFLKVEVSPTK
jgi:hypothetical protein